MEKRQEKILKLIIKEYIRSAEPVSSKWISQKYKIDLSSASLRLEMAKLKNDGYLFQPYTSAGSIPTESAYRFFAKKLCSPRLSSKIEEEIEKAFLKEKEEEMIEELGKLIALFSKGISLLFFENKIFWQGLSFLMSQPEFCMQKDAIEAIVVFENICDKIERIEEDLLINTEIKIFIGKSDPFICSKELSLIIGGFKNGIVGILGPERMDYTTNIALVKKAKEMIEEKI